MSRNGQCNILSLFQGGGFYLLGVQLLAVVAIATWTALVSFVVLKLIDVTVGLRLSLEDEIKGSDLAEHEVGTLNATMSEFFDDEDNTRKQCRSRLQSLVRQRRPSMFDGRRDSIALSNSKTLPEPMQLKPLASSEEEGATCGVSTISIVSSNKPAQETTQTFLPLL